MLGDRSIFDILVKTLERSSHEYRQELSQDLQNVLETGGCFEDEGFLPTTCNGEVVTIKPLIWFRSRREALELMMMINRLEE